MEASAIVVSVIACFGVVVALIVVSAVVAARRERERREALRVWAKRHGWQVVERPQVEWGRRMPGGNRRGVSLALFGTLGGRPVAVGDYSYTTTSTSTDANGATHTTTTTHHYIAVVVRLRTPRPSVAVHRRGGGSKLWRSMFGDRATAVGIEAFDRAYRVNAQDASLVRAVIGGTLIAEHVAGWLPDWSVEGNELLTFVQGRIGAPERIPAQVGPLLRVAELIEAHATT
ncbi:hypothetical protein Daura_49480 [Dactylosporangium aurantiacum]|uniref:Uncharacterized protein n=1 Tax=Dactylosporangium aurantiacum TaxID=35754 RepID=A0A9Q9IKC7_9ACTN|nr:hypothetical protein [Dactylosporangium aurantiacum]MDG6110293.1 hypothetical protein [Dactylosporangium aurantiacum]UWZ54390.1 hypothetical protein Daura_49480 [Dactylosporangium aurantiacum]